MNEINVMTIGGGVKICRGEKFQAYDRKHSVCLYQFLGLRQGVNGEMLERPVYLHDETHDKYMDVSYGWFALKLIVVQKEEFV